ncbi:UDP-N-acetylglucosamine 2-epimerase [Ectobacillus polymachus]|uniref:UDP-N-acetylglucosamine 2-epimerase n=1 Tax=Ectobacillus polymachus TaxID=1508806 RepID=UPI003A88604D
MFVNERKICVVTGTRAEYGLLYWLMKEIDEDPDLSLQIVVTGMHLSPEFGLTYREIEKDGFKIDRKVEMLLSSDTPVGIAKSMGVATMGFAEVFEQLSPDLLVVLGDRYEILTAAQAAMVARIPIAHIHGGETTEGLIDEAIRHSVTKMAHLHFVAAEPYRKRVIQLGEHPERVWNVGATAIDNIHRLKLLEKEEFENAIQFPLRRKTFLVTYHPVTLNKMGPLGAMKELLKALDTYKDAQIIFTKSNSDTEGRLINQMIDEFVQQNPERSIAYTSLGQLRYLSAIRHSDVVIGNSSSGLVEAPFFQKPTVNLGDRQKGRLKAESIIDCKENSDDIILAITKAISEDFQQKLKHISSPYGTGKVAQKIKRVLKEVSLEDVLMKKFYDLEQCE